MGADSVDVDWEVCSRECQFSAKTDGHKRATNYQADLQNMQVPSTRHPQEMFLESEDTCMQAILFTQKAGRTKYEK